jgi:hypothetical protein
MDRAHRATDEILEKIEADMGRIYREDPALKRIKEQYEEYMQFVQKETIDLYEAYIAEQDREKRAEKREEYARKVRELTIESAKYSKLIKRFVAVMADVNQKALNVVNKATSSVYVLNYNNVADDCRRAGIRVYGKE